MENTHMENTEKTKKAKGPAKKTIWLIIIAGIVLWAVLNYAVAFSAVNTVIRVLMPIIIGFCAAYILNVLKNGIEKYLFRPLDKKCTKIWPRIRSGIGILLSILILVAILALVITMLVPQIRITWEMLVASIPGYWDHLQLILNDLTTKYGLDAVELPEIEIDYESLLDLAKRFLTSGVGAAFGSAFDAMTSFFGTVVNFVLGFIFAIYMLADKDNLSKQCVKLVKASFSETAAEEVFYIGRTANTIFSGFVVGQCIEACILGGLCAIGMLILGFPYASMISVLIGVTALIPVFGAFFGTAIGAFLILMVDPIKAIWFVIFIIVIQQIDGNFIYPRVVGGKVGLPPLWTLIGVVLGGAMGGVFGMLVGVPTLALVYTLVGRWTDKRIQKKKSMGELTEDIQDTAKDPAIEN